MGTYSKEEISQLKKGAEEALEKLDERNLATNFVQFELNLLNHIESQQQEIEQLKSTDIANESESDTDDCYELAVYKRLGITSKRAHELIEQNQQLQAQAAVMRKALDSIERRYSKHLKTEITDEKLCEVCTYDCADCSDGKCVFDKARSTTAGKELLNKHKLMQKTIDDIHEAVYGNLSQPEAISRIKSIIDSVTE